MWKTDSTVGRCGQVLNGGKSQLLIGQKDKNISKDTENYKEYKPWWNELPKTLAQTERICISLKHNFFNCHILVYKNVSISKDLYHKEK